MGLKLHAGIKEKHTDILFIWFHIVPILRYLYVIETLVEQHSINIIISPLCEITKG